MLITSVNKKPIDVAREFGERLPSFASLSDATRHYESYTRAGIEALEGLTASLPGFAMDYSPDSLKRLEEVYFNLTEGAGFAGLGLTQQDFESLIGVYFAAVVTRNNPKAHLVVQEFAFTPGKYELGVAKGSTTVMVASLQLSLMQPLKKKRDRLYKMFQRYFGRDQ
jgi:hypothetical protein